MDIIKRSLKSIELNIILIASSMLVCSVAFADPDTAVSVSTIAVPPGSPWYATLVAAIFPALMGALIWLSGRISQFVASKLEDVKRNEQSKWYSMIAGLAGIAVRAAETQYGSNTQQGKEKKAYAVNWLLARAEAIDSSIKKHVPNIQELLEGFVDAAYADAFGALAPLGTPVKPV